jgi:sugar porter (SP) family MFS transporter
MSGIIGSEQFNREFPATKQDGPNDVHTGTVQGTVTSCYEVGCFFGAMFAYFVGEKAGRRRMMLGGAIVMIIGAIITTVTYGPGDPSGKGNVGGFVQFFIGRVITGLGNGANTATIPSWIAESSKAHNRGFLICMEASTVAVGTVIAYWLNFGLSYVDKGGVSWRFPIAFQIFFALLLIIGVLGLPESPRWLLLHNYEEEAQRVIAALAGEEFNSEKTIADKLRMSEAIEAQIQAQAKRSDILKQGKKQNLTRTLVGASTQMFQQLGGCNAVIYYSTILFHNQIGLEMRLSLVLGGVLSIVYMLFALLSFTLVEKVGRRKLFLIGTVGQAVSMFITWGCLLPGTTGPAKGAAFGLHLFIAFFGATWLPLPWLYPAELNSMSVRTQANAISTMTNWLCNFLVVQVLPTMTASIGAWTFFLFACSNIIFLPIIWLFYPETSGRSLEELDVVYAHGKVTKRRPTIVANELPKLTDHQVQVMTDRYDIHGPNAEVTEEDAIDTSLPPKAAPGHKAGMDGRSVSPSPNHTRVPTPTDGLDLEKTSNN